MKHPLPEKLRGLTQALFYEFRHMSKCNHPPIYNLKDKEWEGTKSMYLEYMKYPTEYDAAIAILGSWPHWCKLKQCNWFKEHYDKWEEERLIRDLASATTTLLKAAEGGDTAAARTVLTHFGDKKKPSARGRPVKKPEGAGKTVKDRALSAALQRFNVVDGGKGEG